MSEQYWVVGGRYTDTSFSELEPGEKETRLGPFATHDQANAVWRAKAMETVDEAYARFHIERERHDEFWVVGGEYTDTDFQAMKPGTEERLGPYSRYEDAEKVWKQKSMAAIDDAYVRYRIDQQ
ncbi:DUF4170 domain-containing protein [Marivibrio halodurans]|uniref:DUF4170 domain-containing protein n=1 Tax=Marivibrio halodurans TaxID=2039722 RepID=A0A8J7V252_9PROT|nr:DUF4170 domain-containing protein [Marivibrio halodurans]MBP5856497.1 DUF4170 domain-containing protein [Marivibrio halodurans]